VDDHPPARRQPYATRVWPPPEQAPPDQDDAVGEDTGPQDALPPSGRWYGTPAAPARRLPVWVPRVLVAVAAVVTGGAVITGLVLLVLNGVKGAGAVSASVADNLAGVSYPLPAGWREGKVAPVTGFTSVVAHGDDTIVMTRPGDAVTAAGLRKATLDLTDQYSRLLLHGDKVSVVDDRDLTLNGRAGHTRSLLAEYSDVVNRPSYLRVTLLAGVDGRSTVVLAIAQPDDPRRRADIEAIMSGVR
jgi:hypothetical protein